MNTVYSQEPKQTDTLNKAATNIILTGDSTILRIPIPGVCKGYRELVIKYVEYTDVLAEFENQKTPTMRMVLGKSSESLIQVHGNLMYSGLYRSVVDTPFSGSNLMQHTVQVYLDILWKKKYPFRLYLTNRFNNNNYFRNFFNFNFHYNSLDLAAKIKQQLMQDILKKEADSLREIEQEIQHNQNLIASLKKKWGTGDVLQKIVETREAAFRRRLVNNISEDDTTHSKIDMADSLEKINRRKIDSIEKHIIVLQSLYGKLKQKSADNTRDIYQIQTISGLRKKLKELQIPDSSLPAGYKTLLAIKSIGIGRTMINYSELSARNLIITGLNVEYAPHLYYAFAAGTVDYRFTDYVVQNSPKLPSQYIILGRVGFMQNENSSLIFTYYTGKRQFYNSSATLQGNIPNYQLSGFTVEKRIQLNKDNYLVGELAKSSMPYNNSIPSGQHEGLHAMFNFSKRENEAVSLKFVSNIQTSQTNIEASIKRVGAEFQSFSLFSTGSNQWSWSFKFRQLLLQKRLRFTATAQQNEYDNPLVGTMFKNTSLMMGLQATLHLKRIPVLSAGFYPSSQIVKINSLSYSVTQFYTFTGSASHFYKVQNTQMSSTLIFTQFYNHSNDSGFVYYNTKNLLLSQTASFGNFNLQANISLSANTNYNLSVYDGGVFYHVVKWLDMNAGVKYNYQSFYNIKQWGYSSGVSISVPKFGTIKIQAEKGFIPGPNKQLIPNNIGRINYITNF